jgi:hypothetical protein
VVDASAVAHDKTPREGKTNSQTSSAEKEAAHGTNTANFKRLVNVFDVLSLHTDISRFVAQSAALYESPSRDGFSRSIPGQARDAGAWSDSGYLRN